MKPKYERYVELKNKRAKLNGFSDYGDLWRQKYETTTFEQQILDLYKEMEPLYKHLHAFVRRKLFDIYGEDVIDIKVLRLRSETFWQFTLFNHYRECFLQAFCLICGGDFGTICTKIWYLTQKSPTWTLQMPWKNRYGSCLFIRLLTQVRDSNIPDRISKNKSSNSPNYP